jgi:hypothetical protein
LGHNFDESSPSDKREISFLPTFKIFPNFLLNKIKTLTFGTTDTGRNPKILRKMVFDRHWEDLGNSSLGGFTNTLTKNHLKFAEVDKLARCLLVLLNDAGYDSNFTRSGPTKH